MENNYLINELVNNLSKGGCCRDYIDVVEAQNWIHEYISYFTNEYICRENKECILYSLLFILNELKSVPTQKFDTYFYNPEYLLDDVIIIAKEEKDWHLDKHSALGLCSKIVVDYLVENTQDMALLNFDDTVRKYNMLFVNPDSNMSALRQIIRNYSYKVDAVIFDPVWELYFDQLMDENDDDEDYIYSYYDIDELEYMVRHRKILPDIVSSLNDVGGNAYGYDSSKNLA